MRDGNFLQKSWLNTFLNFQSELKANFSKPFAFRNFSETWIVKVCEQIHFGKVDFQKVKK